MTRLTHPAFRRLSASGATASRLHAAMERAERELRAVAFDVGGLRLLDDTVLSPLTRTVRVSDALARVPSGPAVAETAPPGDVDGDAEPGARRRRVPESGARARETMHENERITTRRTFLRDDLANREDARDGRARADVSRHSAHDATAKPSRAARVTASPGTARVPSLANVSHAALREAQEAVARRLAAGVTPSSATRELDKPRGDGLLRMLSPAARRRDFAPGGAIAAEAASDSSVAGITWAGSAATPLRIGTASRAVAAILERVSSDHGSRPLLATVPPADDRRSASNAAVPSEGPHRELGMSLERALDRAATRGARGVRMPRSPLSPAADARESQVPPTGSATDAGGSGLRRLIARAGVTPLSAAHPPQAGVERAEGTMGVVADRMEENALAQRLARLLRREARRDGIDVDEGGA